MTDCGKLREIRNEREQTNRGQRRGQRYLLRRRELVDFLTLDRAAIVLLRHLPAGVAHRSTARLLGFGQFGAGRAVSGQDDSER